MITSRVERAPAGHAIRGALTPLDRLGAWSTRHRWLEQARNAKPSLAFGRASRPEALHAHTTSALKTLKPGQTSAPRPWFR
jgi:hypothetical protein